MFLPFPQTPSSLARLERTKRAEAELPELVMQAVDPEETTPSVSTFNINASRALTAPALRSNGD